MMTKGFHKDVKIIYIYGPSGSGKSFNAIEIMKQHNYENFENVKHNKSDFWLGVNEGEGCCLYDDFRDSDMKANEFINFIDYNIHTMNIKGGCVPNKYSLIIITSIKSPYQLYDKMKEEEKKQWLRRMIIYECQNLELTLIEPDI